MIPTPVPVARALSAHRGGRQLALIGELLAVLAALAADWSREHSPGCGCAWCHSGLFRPDSLARDVSGLAWALKAQREYFDAYYLPRPDPIFAAPAHLRRLAALAADDAR